MVRVPPVHERQVLLQGVRGDDDAEIPEGLAAAGDGNRQVDAAEFGGAKRDFQPDGQNAVATANFASATLKRRCQGARRAWSRASIRCWSSMNETTLATTSSSSSSRAAAHLWIGVSSLRAASASACGPNRYAGPLEVDVVAADGRIGNRQGGADGEGRIRGDEVGESASTAPALSWRSRNVRRKAAAKAAPKRFSIWSKGIACMKLGRFQPYMNSIAAFSWPTSQPILAKCLTARNAGQRPALPERYSVLVGRRTS